MMGMFIVAWGAVRLPSLFQPAIGLLPGDDVARLIAGTLLGVLGTALGGWTISRLIARDRARFGPTTRALCRRLGLSRDQRRLAGRIARAVSLPCAASVLVSRGCFDRAVERAPLSREEAQRLRVMRQRIFGS